MSENKLPRELRLGDAFRFPISTPQGRRDLIMGGCLVIVLLLFGWILNLGNRLNVVRRLFKGETPIFRGFAPWGETFTRGCTSFAAISCYLAPAALTGTTAYFLKSHGYGTSSWFFAILSGLAFCLAVFTLPGGMTVYACEGALTVLKNPRHAFLRAWRNRAPYMKAWAISALAIGLSFFGLLAFGLGFAFTSVWAWNVVGYAFTVAMYKDER